MFDSTNSASLVWPFFQETVWFPGFFADMRGVVEGREGRENWAIRKEKKSAIGSCHFLQLNRKGHMVKSITLDNLSTNILPAFLAFPCSFFLRTYVMLWFFSVFVQAGSYHYIPLALYVVKWPFGAAVRPDVFECAEVCLYSVFEPVSQPMWKKYFRRAQKTQSYGIITIIFCQLILQVITKYWIGELQSLRMGQAEAQ